MKTFLISYDLRLPEDHNSYSILSDHIKSVFSKWARPVKSVWIIKSDMGSGEVRDRIKEVLDNNDKLIVVELSGNWGTYNISKEVTDWMKANM